MQFNMKNAKPESAQIITAKSILTTCVEQKSKENKTTITTETIKISKL